MSDVTHIIIKSLNRGSRARISGCNVVRNGFGSKRQPTSSTDDNDRRPVVPSGHSGMCVYFIMCLSDNRSYCSMSRLTHTSHYHYYHYQEYTLRVACAG